MRRSTLNACAATLALAALSQVADADAIPLATGRPSAPPVRVQLLERSLLAGINELRVRHRLRPLRPTRGLRRAAVVHSLDMARRGYFDHTSADGTDFSRRIGRFYRIRGYRSWVVGENLAMSSPTMDAHETVSDWLASPGHRENLLDRRWREVGVAAVYSVSAPGEFEGDPTVIVTVDFGYRRPWSR